MPQPITRNHPAITEEQELASMLKGIWGYTENNPKNYIITELAMKFAIYIFQRLNEIRGLLWESVNMDKRYLNFIASKTKQDHIVPLSDQAYRILKQIQQLQFNSIYVFPGVKTNKTFISNCTIGQGLKQIGFGGKQTAHGFRATASITGLIVNAFMVQFAYEKAQALIQDHQNLRLSRADHDMLLEMLENPRPANQALKDLMSLLDED